MIAATRGNCALFTQLREVRTNWGPCIRFNRFCPMASQRQPPSVPLTGLAAGFRYVGVARILPCDLPAICSSSIDCSCQCQCISQLQCCPLTWSLCSGSCGIAAGSGRSSLGSTRKFQLAHDMWYHLTSVWTNIAWADPSGWGDVIVLRQEVCRPVRRVLLRGSALLQAMPFPDDALTSLGT